MPLVVGETVNITNNSSTSIIVGNIVRIENTSSIILKGDLDFVKDAHHIGAVVERMSDLPAKDLFYWAFFPHTGVGYAHYHAADDEDKILVRRFQLRRIGADTELTIAETLHIPTPAHRYRLIDKLINKDGVQNIATICKLTDQPSSKAIEDLKVLGRWESLRDKIITLIANEGFNTSEAVKDILNMDNALIVKLMARLRKRGTIPASKYASAKPRATAQVAAKEVDKQK